MQPQPHTSSNILPIQLITNRNYISKFVHVGLTSANVDSMYGDYLWEFYL